MISLIVLDCGIALPNWLKLKLFWLLWLVGSEKSVLSSRINERISIARVRAS